MAAREQRRHLVFEHIEQVQLVGHLELCRQAGCHRVIGQHLQLVRDAVPVPGVAALDASKGTGQVAEATANGLPVAIPGRPARDGVVQEHKAKTFGHQRFEMARKREGRRRLAGRRFRAKLKPGHVVQHKGIKLPGQRRLKQRLGQGLLDVRPANIGQRIEHRKERRLVERMPFGDERNVDRLGHGSVSCSTRKKP